METDTCDLCCGCLSSGRKMKHINNYFSNKDFCSFFNEMELFQTQLDDFPLWLCWECEAHITNYMKFKAQMKSCWIRLQKYIQECNKTHVQSVSKLTISTQMCFDTHMAQNEYNSVKTNQTYDVKTNQTYDVKKNQTYDVKKNQTYDVKANQSLVQIKMNSVPDLEVKVKVEDYSDDDRSLIDIRNDEKVKKRVKGVKKSKVKKRKKQVMFEEITLSKEEILEDRATAASKEEYIDAIFKCEKCIIPYANEDDLRDHENAKHTISSKHVCEFCTRGFPSGGALSAHWRRHAVRWRCIVCRYRSPGRAAAAHHYSATHAPGEIFELAAKAFGKYEEKTQEKQDLSVKSPGQHPCQHCEKTFRWKTSLRKHLESHRIAAGQARRPYCAPCDLPFTTASNLRKHLRTSSKHQIMARLRKLKEDPPANADPTQQAKEIENIKSSINSQKELYPCPQCEKKFQWKGNLLRHLQSHAARANGELVCAPCNRTFSSIATYKQHMKISRKHVSEDDFKYVCSECGKRFANKIKLRDHVDWDHLKNYKHTCDNCQKVFKSHTSLYLHRQVVHRLSNVDHLCDHCGKSFPNKTKLSSHVTALHTGDSPYKCTTCAARFSWHSCLSRHIRKMHATKPATG